MPNSRHPVQQRLFSRIIDRFRGQSNAIADYQKAFSVSRATAYKHFTGESAITGDEFMRIMAHYQLHDLDVWPEGWPDTHFVITLPSMQPDVHA
jgi:hypothetical protein